MGWEGGGVKEVDEEAIHSRQSQWSRARKVSDKWKKTHQIRNDNGVVTVKGVYNETGTQLLL